MNPRAPKGHRLTGEPIPDLGQRVAQTARYQAPESRLNQQRVNDYFPFWEAFTKFTIGRTLQPDSNRIDLERNCLECFLEKINQSGDGSGPANNP